MNTNNNNGNKSRKGEKGDDCYKFSELVFRFLYYMNIYIYMVCMNERNKYCLNQTKGRKRYCLVVKRKKLKKKV